MNPSRICSACRRILGALPPSRLIQWHSRAMFISLSNNTRTTTDEQEKEELLKLGEQDGKQKGRYSPIILEEKRRVLQPAQGNRPVDGLEILFAKSLQAPSASNDTPPQSIISLEPYKNAELLKGMLSGSSPLTDSWRFFVEHFGPDATQPGFTKHKYNSMPSYVNSIALELLRGIIRAKRAHPMSQTLPTVTELSRVYLRLGRLSGPLWSEMMFLLLECLLRTEQLPPADVEALLKDLLGGWNVVCRQRGNLQHFPPAGSEFLNWSYVPALSSWDMNRMQRTHGPQAGFGMLTPTFPVRHLEGIPMVALATFRLVTNDTTVAKTVSANALPFIILLSRIISTPGLTLNHVYGRDESPPIITEFVKSNWTMIRERASQISQSPQEAAERPVKIDGSNTGQPVKSTFINKRLQDALKRGNVQEVDGMWSDAVQWSTKKTQGAEITNLPQNFSMKRGVLTEELCNYFILIYMSLRQPNRAVDVWNHMLKSGLQPALKTWDSMLSGCKASRDWMTLEGVWRKMQASGVEPDVVCWTTRISGLIESNQVDLGIRALDEMGCIWIAAAKKAHPRKKIEELKLLTQIDGAVKPTIETINAAVAGLIRKQSPDAAHRILAWAGSYGISPNLRTFNTLLRPLVRHGLNKQATALLEEMQKAGFQADVATFTTILDETFRHSEHHTPEEQRDIVDSIFHEMTKAGVTANLHTYGKIIYELLQSSHGNISIVNAVMEQMAKQGLQPSAQIYTILVKYYFEKTPPNLDAVRGIIERVSMTDGGADHVFWDRVVEGYARAGQTAHALRILGKVNSANQKVGYLALRMLLFALAENGEWDSARSLVRNVVLDTGGPLSAHVHGKLGEHKFWELAANLQLLDNSRNV